MEDRLHFFDWSPAKGTYMVLLVGIEEGRISWADTDKIDLVHRAHA